MTKFVEGIIHDSAKLAPDGAILNAGAGVEYEV
jgi:hypothetical protein